MLSVFRALFFKRKNYIAALVFLFYFFSMNYSAFAVSDSVDVGQEVIGSCNNNGACQAGLGETAANCPLDCASIPVPTVPGGGGSGFDGGDPPAIYNLSVQEIGETSAKILWQTSEPALCQIFLGLTEEYEKESISENLFKSAHSVLLPNLLPGSLYYFKISCQDTYKKKGEAANKFITLSPPDLTAPANVSDFHAAGKDSEIFLSWKNPPDSDFQFVRIFRSEKFYPASPAEGDIVYEGRKENFSDLGLANGKKYYYSAFAFDFSGNYSSGAVAAAVPKKDVISSISPRPSQPSGSPSASPSIAPAPSISPSPTPISALEKITLEDFEFVQNGKKILPKDGIIEIDPESSLEISIDYGKVNGYAAATMLILEDSSDSEKINSFLLSLDPKKTKYSAVITPPSGSKSFKQTLVFLNEKNDISKTVSSQLKIGAAAKVSQEISWYFYLFLLLLIALILFILRYILKKAGNWKSFEIITKKKDQKK